MRNGQVLQPISALEVAMRAGAFGVDDSFWDPASQRLKLCFGSGVAAITPHTPLSVKVRQQVDQMEILQEQRAVDSGTLGGVGMRDWCAVGRGVHAVHQLSLASRQSTHA